MPTLCGLGLLGACIPIVTLAVDGSTRVLFGGAYVVDRTSLLLKVLLLLSGYVVVLLSTNFVAEGDYWESEYYLMLLSSIAGMVVMCSARDFVTIFVALELLSLPAYMLATWNKRDARSNEAGLKYYLMGVFASALMLYGMSLLFGVSGTTILADDGAGPRRGRQLDADHHARHRADHRRLRLQGVRRAVPHLGARHLRGRPHAGHGLPLRALQDRRLRGPAAAHPLRLRRSVRRRRAALLDPVRGLDDRGQPDRAAPDEHRAHAGLLGRRPGRLHDGPVRGDGVGQRGPGVLRRRSPIS